MFWKQKKLFFLMKAFLLTNPSFCQHTDAPWSDSCLLLMIFNRELLWFRRSLLLMLELSVKSTESNSCYSRQIIPSAWRKKNLESPSFWQRADAQRLSDSYWGSSTKNRLEGRHPFIFKKDKNCVRWISEFIKKYKITIKTKIKIKIIQFGTDANRKEQNK
jgi:hypothetical protein